RLQRRLDRGRTILVDAGTAPGTGIGGGAVLLSLADLGEHPRLRDLGRSADRFTGGRLRRGGGVRVVPAVAREQCAAAGGGGNRARMKPLELLAKERLNHLRNQARCNLAPVGERTASSI